ncbi:helix-turn-helix domain-containing protein [Calothrix sp. PCC 6303]|uniref:helix-turn-helix domain-containing protein n=2 Tax=Calothrix sp. PCC 6303 TaxID=1170562 RepID=UPI002AB1834D|nr:helix-turn-helix transcriptional regulator [Calothrix sp. PCC 6303]
MMIKNEQQYQNAKEWLQQFEQSVADFDSNKNLQVDPKRWQLHRDSYQSQVDELKAEIVEYERLINCDNNQSITVKVESLNKLPEALIKARIASKISLYELAEILGIDEQRVKEYENTDYQCTSFIEILEVATALGVDFENAVLKVDFEEIEAVKRTAKKWYKSFRDVETKVS